MSDDQRRSRWWMWALTILFVAFTIFFSLLQDLLVRLWQTATEPAKEGPSRQPTGATEDVKSDTQPIDPARSNRGPGSMTVIRAK